MKHDGPCKPWCSVKRHDLCHGPDCCPHLHRATNETKRAEK